MLLQAVVLVVILVFVASIAATVILGRAMVVSNALANDEAHFDAQTATSQLNGCMQDATAATCTPARMSACGFPLTSGGKKYTAAAVPNAATNSCQITVSICTIGVDPGCT